MPSWPARRSRNGSRRRTDRSTVRDVKSLAGPRSGLVAQLPGQREHHVLFDRLDLIDVAEADSGQPVEYPPDQGLRHRRTAGDTDAVRAFQPFLLDGRAIVYQV